MKKNQIFHAAYGSLAHVRRLNSTHRSFFDTLVLAAVHPCSMTEIAELLLVSTDFLKSGK